MNAKTAKKLRRIATVYGVTFKAVALEYEKQGEALIKKAEERGGLENYGKIKNEIKKADIKAFNEVMAEQAAKEAEEAKKKDDPKMVEAFAYGANGKKIKLKMNVETNQILEGGDAKNTGGSAAIGD